MIRLRVRDDKDKLRIAQAPRQSLRVSQPQPLKISQTIGPQNSRGLAMEQNRLWKSGQITPEQYKSRIGAIYAGELVPQSKEILQPTTNRQGIGQFTQPIIGSLASGYTKGLSNLATFTGNALEAAGAEGVGNSINQWARGQSQGIDDFLRASQFDPSPRPGENRFAVNLGSGAGSLLTSLSMRNPNAAGGLFGLQAGADQIRGARDAGVSPGRALAIGAGAGIVEGGLEKIGLDRLLKTGGSPVSSFIQGAITEGLQEFSQSLSQSAISDLYKDVDYSDAVTQALIEGGYGALLGGGTGVMISGVNTLTSDPNLRQNIKRNVQRKASQIKQNTDPKILRANVKKATKKYQAAKNKRIDLEEYGGTPAQIKAAKRAETQAENDMMKAKRKLKINTTIGLSLGGPLATDFNQQKKAGRVFEGVDGKPRFEIDDSGAKVNVGAIYDNQYNARLDQVLDHPTLFKQYPKLRSVRVTADVLDPGTGAYFDIKNGKGLITLNEAQLENTNIAKTLLHEIQHGIQEIEGFGRGGSPKEGIAKMRQRRQELRQKYAELEQKKKDSIKKSLEKNAYESEAHKQNRARAENEFESSPIVKEFKKLGEQIDELKLGGGMGNYRNLAGEAEARAVAARMNMSDGERQQQGFYDSLDVPREDLIIRDGSGRALSIRANGADGDSIRLNARADRPGTQPGNIRLSQPEFTPTFEESLDQQGRETQQPQRSKGFILRETGSGNQRIRVRRGPEGLEAVEELSGVGSQTTPGTPPQPGQLQPGAIRIGQSASTPDNTQTRQKSIVVSPNQASAQVQQAIQNQIGEQSDVRVVADQDQSLDDSLPPDIIRAQLRDTYPVSRKVAWWDYIRTPDRVLKKIGLKRQADKIRQAHSDYVRELPKQLNRVNEWFEQVNGSPESSQRIFKWLDGDGDIELNQSEAKIANEIKEYLANWADRLGLPEDRRVSDYITHIFEDSLVAKEFDPEMEKLIAEKVPGSVYSPFTEQRLGGQGYVEDVFRALDAYVKRSTRKVHMDQALQELNTASEGLDASAWDYVKQYSDRVNLRPTRIDNLVDNGFKQLFGYKLGPRPTNKISRKIRNWTYRATLGLNIGSALRNLTQGVNTFSQLGTKWTGIGYTKAMNDLFSKSGELQEVGVLSDKFIEDRHYSAMKSAAEKFDRGLWFFFDTAEKINRGAAYYGAKQRALKKGATVEQAIAEGIEMARKTQFTFGATDNPVVLNSDLVKTIAQFQSFNVKQSEFLAEMVQNKEWANMARFAGGTWVIVATIGQALGYEPEEFVPPLEVAKGETRFGQTPFFKTIGNTIQLFTGEKDDFGNETPLEERAKDLAGNLGATTIPAFVQGNKTIFGIRDVNRGYSETRAGNVRYPIEQSTENYIRAGLLGTYNLPEARAYYDNERRPLGENQSAELLNLPPEQRMEAYQNILNQRAETDEEKKARKEATKQLEQDRTTYSANQDSPSLFNKYGLPPVPLNDDIANAYARLQERVNDGEVTDVSLPPAERKIVKDAYLSQLEPTVREFWSLGDDDMRKAIVSGLITKEDMDDVIALDNALFKAGILKYPQVGKTLRGELGYGLADGTQAKSSSRGGRSGGGRSIKVSSLAPKGSVTTANDIRIAFDKVTPKSTRTSVPGDPSRIIRIARG